MDAAPAAAMTATTMAPEQIAAPSRAAAPTNSPYGLGRSLGARTLGIVEPMRDR